MDSSGGNFEGLSRLLAQENSASDLLAFLFELDPSSVSSALDLDPAGVYVGVREYAPDEAVLISWFKNTVLDHLRPLSSSKAPPQSTATSSIVTLRGQASSIRAQNSSIVRSTSKSPEQTRSGPHCDCATSSGYGNARSLQRRGGLLLGSQQFWIPGQSKPMSCRQRAKATIRQTSPRSEWR